MRYTFYFCPGNFKVIKLQIVDYFKSWGSSFSTPTSKESPLRMDWKKIIILILKI